MQSLLHTYRARRNARISSPVRRQSQRHRYSAGAMETMKGEKQIIHWTFADDARDIGSVGLPFVPSPAVTRFQERRAERPRKRASGVGGGGGGARTKEAGGGFRFVPVPSPPLATIIARERERGREKGVSLFVRWPP